MIGEPPLDGTPHSIVAEVAPTLAAVTPVGALGTVAGVTWLLGALGVPARALLYAKR